VVKNLSLLKTSSMARTCGEKPPSKHSSSFLRDQFPNKKGTNMVTPLSSSPPSPPRKEHEIGMGFDSLPPISISPVIFGFLKSLSLKSVGKSLDDVSSILGWEFVVYDPVVAESGTTRIGPEGGYTVDVERVMEDPFLNDDPIGDTANIDSDESDSILQIKQTTQTIPQTASRPAE